MRMLIKASGFYIEENIEEIPLSQQKAKSITRGKALSYNNNCRIPDAALECVKIIFRTSLCVIVKAMQTTCGVKLLRTPSHKHMTMHLKLIRSTSALSAVLSSFQ